MNIARRGFLGTAAAALILGFDGAGEIVRAAYAPDVVGPKLFGIWLSISPDNVITVVSPEVEFGQGTITANAMLVADELDADWNKVAIVQSDANVVYTNPKSYRLSTDGSWGMRGRFEQMRRIGAVTRMLMVQAAANAWSVAPGDCTTSASFVHHAGSGRTASYGSLAGAAAKLPLPAPASVMLRAPDQWRLIGTPQPRVDIAVKSTGQSRYGVDVVVPGMLSAAFARCPVLGGIAKSYDDSKIKSRKGIRHIVNVGYGVAVLADDPWTARKGVEDLIVTWDNGPAAQVSSATIAHDYSDALANTPGVVAKKLGDVTASGAAKTIDVAYTVPYLAHMCTEPTNATAWFHDGVCEFWTATASMSNVVNYAGYLLGLSADKIIVHRTPFVGGSFGLRGRVDPELEAAQLSAIVHAPVQVVRRREEDTQHGWYRPYQKARIIAGIDANSEIVTWHEKVAVQSINGQYADELIPFGVDIAQVNADIKASAAFFRLPVDFYATSGTPISGSYKIPNLLMEWVRMETPLRPTHWRSVGYSGNVFMTEGAVDELAVLAGQDPVAFRRAQLQHVPRFLAVLDALVAKSGWPAQNATAQGWGMALGDGFVSCCAAAVKVAVKGKKITIERVVCVCDQGITVNPEQTEAQIQSGIIDGLATALFGEITITNGQIDQANFNDYRLFTLAEIPPIEITLLPSRLPPGSITEIITPMLIPALAHAVAGATGQRYRELPLSKYGFDV